MNLRKVMPKLLLFAMIPSLLAFQGSYRPEDETAAIVDQPQTVAVQVAGGVVSAEGEVEPLAFHELSFQVGGQVVELLVEEGDAVQVGDPLLRLDTTDAEIALNQATAQLASAEVGLEVARTQLALAEVRINTAARGVEVAEAQLELTKAGPTPEEIAEAEENLAAAEASITQAIGNRDASLEIPEAQIRAAEANVAAAHAELQVLEERYDKILTTCFDIPTRGEICPLYGPIEEQTRAQLEATRAKSDAAQKALDLLVAGATPTQRRAANSAVVAATANRDVSQAQLDLLLADTTPENIRLAELRVEQAQIAVGQAEAGVIEAEAANTQAIAAVNLAQVGVDAAQLALERLTVTALTDGVVAEVDVNPGEVVVAGQPVVTIADFSGWQVKTTDLTELDVARVQPGAAVEVEVDALPNRPISGTVTEIALVSSLSRGDVVYDVTIRLEDVSGLPLRWGMTALVDVDVN